MGLQGREKVLHPDVENIIIVRLTCAAGLVHQTLTLLSKEQIKYSVNVIHVGKISLKDF